MARNASCPRRCVPWGLLPPGPVPSFRLCPSPPPPPRSSRALALGLWFTLSFGQRPPPSSLPVTFSGEGIQTEGALIS